MSAWIPAMLPGSGPAPHGTVSAALVNRVIRGAVNLGASRPALISVLGFNEARLRNPANRMAWQLGGRLFTALEKQFDNPAIILSLGDIIMSHSFSDFGYATRLAPTLAAVIDANCQIQAIRQNVVSVVFDASLTAPALRWKPVEPDYIVDRFVEFSVVSYMQLSVQILGQPMRLREVHFTHAPRFDVAQYRSIYGCLVRFNMPESIAWLDSGQLAEASPYANAVTLDAVHAHYQFGSKLLESGRSNAGKGFFYLSSELDKSPPTLAMMAASFGVSERTLRRRLHDEGYPFRVLLNIVRHNLWSLYRMENRHSLGQIAHLLGFGELSAFSRAHRRWFGMPPSETLKNTGNGGRSKV